jgi:hypothetical protein
MKRGSLLVFCLGLIIFLVGLTPIAHVQELPKKGETREDPILGVWTEIWHEREGTVFDSLPNTNPPAYARGLFGGTEWDISKDRIEIGSGNRAYPRRRYSYKLNPDNKPATIDLFEKEKVGGVSRDFRFPGIYESKEGLLFLTVNLALAKDGARPKKLITTEEYKDTWLFVLRKGKIKFGGSGELGRL